MIPAAPPRFTPVGDAALLVSFGDQISPAINRQVHALSRALLHQTLPGLGEPVPAYSTVLVQYDPLYLDLGRLIEQIQSILARPDTDALEEQRLVELPTLYGGDYGPDLESVAEQHGISAKEVIRIHTQTEYQIYMVGFTPGFAYMGVVDDQIATPRQKTPRQHIRAGSVGIAGSQTGVYPIDSPGGWQIIGYTPIKLFDPDKNPPSLFSPGDRVRFIPISEKDLVDGAAGN
jgi:inhibitor of KinA